MCTVAISKNDVFADVVAFKAACLCFPERQHFLSIWELILVDVTAAQHSWLVARATCNAST